jgi:hypothetical protein
MTDKGFRSSEMKSMSKISESDLKDLLEDKTTSTDNSLGGVNFRAQMWTKVQFQIIIIILFSSLICSILCILSNISAFIHIMPLLDWSGAFKESYSTFAFFLSKEHQICVLMLSR